MSLISRQNCVVSVTGVCAKILREEVCKDFREGCAKILRRGVQRF